MKAGLLLTFTVPGKLYLLTIEALGSLKSLVFCRYMYYMYCRYHVAFARCHTHLMEQHLQASNSVHQRPCTSQMMQNVRFATTLTLNALWNRRSNWLYTANFLLRMTLELRLGLYLANWNSESVKHKNCNQSKMSRQLRLEKNGKIQCLVDRFFHQTPEKFSFHHSYQVISSLRLKVILQISAGKVHQHFCPLVEV